MSFVLGLSSFLGLDSDRWVILIVGSAVASSCALVGSFLVLRRMALLGDAISHSVLPGIAIAYLVAGAHAPILTLIGAGACGVLTVFLVGLLVRTRRLKEDASIGVVFPALFSIGVILLSRYLSSVHIDVDCVLYGEIGLAPIDPLIPGRPEFGPKAIWVSLAILILDLLVVIVFYKELKVASFDPQLAAALGISPVVVHYLLMSAVSVTVVGSFESVGAILVVAMLVVPPATAYLLTDRLRSMIALAVAFGIASTATGYALAYAIDCSIAAAMATMAGVFFLLALVLSPRYGLVARALFRLRLARRLREQLFLLHLSGGSEAVDPASLAARFNWSPKRVERVVRRLAARNLVERVRTAVRLTPAGAHSIEGAGAGPLVHGPDAAQSR